MSKYIFVSNSIIATLCDQSVQVNSVLSRDEFFLYSEVQEKLNAMLSLGTVNCFLLHRHSKGHKVLHLPIVSASS